MVSGSNDCSKQAALFQVQCEIKDIIAQELKMERDAAFVDLQNSQAAACNSRMSAFKTMHARLVSISQEAARSEKRESTVFVQADVLTGSG